MTGMTSLAGVGASVSRFQAVGLAPKLTDQQAAPEKSNTVRAAAQLLQSVLAIPDARHDLDVVA